MTKTPLPLILLTLAIAGCSSDDRVVDIATTAADRQAEQNEEVVRLNREVAQGTRQLVEADAKAREDFARLHHDFRPNELSLTRNGRPSKSSENPSRSSGGQNRSLSPSLRRSASFFWPSSSLASAGRCSLV
jgi:hypothetical protein